MVEVWVVHLALQKVACLVVHLVETSDAKRVGNSVAHLAEHWDFRSAVHLVEWKDAMWVDGLVASWVARLDVNLVARWVENLVVLSGVTMAEKMVV